MGHVFISYSRRDRIVVDAIVAKLEEVGLDIWIDRDDIRAGRQWRLEIVKAIDTADSFVLHLSPSSAVSKNVRRELDLAEDSYNAFVLPVMLAEMDIPAGMRYQLAGTQRIDFYADPKSCCEELKEILLERQRALANKKGLPSHRDVELVISEERWAKFDNEKHVQLIALLSELTDANPQDLIIIRVVEGSIHVFVKMPVQVAYELKAIVLEEAHILAEHGIKEMRFAGDKKFIPTVKDSKPGKPVFLGKLLMLGVFILLGVALIYGGWWLKKQPSQHPVTMPIPIFTETEEKSTSPPTLTPTLTATPTATETSVNNCQPPAYSVAGTFCMGSDRYINIDINGSFADMEAYSVTVNGDKLSCTQYQPRRLTCGVVTPPSDRKAIISVYGPSCGEGDEICITGFTGYPEQEACSTACPPSYYYDSALETFVLSGGSEGFSCATFNFNMGGCPESVGTQDDNGDGLVCGASCDLNKNEATCLACGCSWYPSPNKCDSGPPLTSTPAPPTPGP